MTRGLALLAGASLAVLAGLATGAERAPVAVGYLGEPGGSAERGFELGLDEANVQGGFLGWSFERRSFERAPEQDAGIAALVAAAPPAVLAALAGGSVAVLDIASSDDALRERCLPGLLHVLPSERMLRAAREQWLEKQPASSAVARAWHADYAKFAARDLNLRFRARYAAPMDDAAWAGWAAARAVAEAVLRGGSADASSVARYLRGALSFDGQKGTALRFGESGELRQPLLLVEGERLVGEAPLPGRDLDSLGVADCAARGEGRSR